MEGIAADVKSRRAEEDALSESVVRFGRPGFRHRSATWNRWQTIGYGLMLFSYGATVTAVYQALDPLVMLMATGSLSLAVLCLVVPQLQRLPKKPRRVRPLRTQPVWPISRAFRRIFAGHLKRLTRLSASLTRFPASLLRPPVDIIVLPTSADLKPSLQTPNVVRESADEDDLFPPHMRPFLDPATIYLA